MLLSSVAPLLLLSVSSVVVETALPGCRGDRDTDHRPRQNCSAAGFDHVPPGIEPSTQVLLFPLNQFSQFSWSSFTVFKEIHEIDLSKNQISALPQASAEVLPSLSVLLLASNLLRAVPDHSFSGSPALTKLELQDNLLSSVTDLSFSGLSKLEVLDLSNNHLQTLPERMMFPLSVIETLYLEGNKIKVMPDGWFSPKEDVEYLYLSANPWACSCSLGYLHSYLQENDDSVYVRDGTIIRSDVLSVTCGSPESLRGQSVYSLQESDFCGGLTSDEHFHDPTTEIMTTTTATTTTTTATTTTTTATTTTTTATTTTTTATTIPTTAASTAIITPTTTALPPVVEYVTSGFYEVVTWYETFTRFREWPDSWESLRGDGRKVKKTTVPPKTEPPTTTLTTSPTAAPQTPTKPTTLSTFEATEMVAASTTHAKSDVSMTVTSNMPQTSTKSYTFTSKYVTETDPTTITTFESVKTTPVVTISDFSTVSNVRVSGKMVSAARGVFCFWLFLSCVFLCVISGVSSLIIALRLYFWYHGVYKSLKYIIAGKEQIRMASCSGTQARYRTMLFIARDAKEEECYVNLGPKDRILQVKNVEKAVYEQTMYRDFSKEEEIDAEEVLAGCGASPEANNDDARKKRYSVILREVREKDDGETEKCDWVVGGWEAEQRTGLRGSWGAWLGQFLPSMPWGVGAPPKSAAECEERSINEDKTE